MTLQNTLSFGSILADTRHIESPTIEQVLRLTPHIPEATVRAEYERVTTAPVTEYPTWYFAVPGVHVKGSYYRYRLGMTSHGGSGLWVLVVSGDSCGNTFVRDGLSPTAFSTEAHEWQKAHFSYDKMIDPLNSEGRPRWGWFCENWVMDPSRRVPDYFERRNGADTTPKPVEHGMQPGRPVAVAGLAFVFEYGKGPNERQTHYRWDAEEADCDLIIHSQQKLLWMEVKGANRHISGAPTTYCACCGRSLHMTGCAHCDYRYRDNQFDCGGGPPINIQGQALVEKFGWTFKEDPQIARDEATSDYERQREEVARWNG